MLVCGLRSEYGWVAAECATQAALLLPLPVVYGNRMFTAATKTVIT
jgi:hypothetical protein